MTDFDLLTEPHLRARDRLGHDLAVTLPGALAGLATGDLTCFTGLRRHQQHAWHAFLVQLAAIALHRAGESEPPTDEARWRELLLDLTDGAREPWCLLVADLSRPAFFQPPVPEGTLAGFKDPITEPDALDILVTSKNHDDKAARAITPEPDLWVYALMTLQTMQGFLGAGNYGIARMNGGFGNRPGVAFAPALDPAARFRADLAALLADRARLVDELGYRDRDGHALLFLLPWDGTNALGLGDCDPYFIDICRRIRLGRGDDGSLVARACPTRCARVDAKSRLGFTGDPWTPVRRADEAKALTVAGGGFHYRLTQELLLTGEWLHGAAADSSRVPGRGWFVLEALARGQGETQGYHERLVPIPPKIRPLLGRTQERDRLGALAKARVEAAGKCRREVLRGPLQILFQGDPAKPDWKDDRPTPWLDALDASVDREFFPRLWADAELPADEAQQRWLLLLRALAQAQLESAIGRAPLPVARRYRAIAAAERVFRARFRKVFPEYQWDVPPAAQGVTP